MNIPKPAVHGRRRTSTGHYVVVVAERIHPNAAKPVRELLSYHLKEIQADDLKQTGQPDDARIDVEQDHELGYWAKELDVSREQLRQVVQHAADRQGRAATPEPLELSRQVPFNGAPTDELEAITERSTP